MPLTFGQAKKLVAKYAGTGGKCATSDDVGIFLKTVLEKLLYAGTHGNERKYCFLAKNGCFTIPYELEVPLKVQLDNMPGTVWDRWFEFNASVDFMNNKCIPAKALVEDPNHYPIVYDLPPGGSHIGVMGTCIEESTAHLIVQGTDTTGREIYTTHKGEQIYGEYLTVKKGELRYTQSKFGQITAVNKEKTNGYATLFAYDPNTGKRIFLADYSPLETAPQYRRFQIMGTPCGPCAKVSVLGRIRLKTEYADEEFIPFDATLPIILQAQSLNTNENNDMATTQAKEAFLDSVIEKENNYKKVNTGNPLDILPLTAGGSIKGLY